MAMSRAPWVLAGTAAGLAGLLAFHSTPVKVTLGTVPTTQGPSSAGGTPTTTQPPTGKRSATGSTVNYYFGTLAVTVNVSGAQLTSVKVTSLNDGGNPQSQYIDQYAIPILEREATSAQSANIQGVSGASYTSAGFTQSLQSALSTLGL